jgi:hypothetical protein
VGAPAGTAAADSRRTVAGVAPQPCPAPEDEFEQQQPLPGVCGTVTVTFTSGAQDGTRVSTDIPAGPGALRVGEGDDVVLLLLDENGGGQSYSIVDFQQSTQLCCYVCALKS